MLVASSAARTLLANARRGIVAPAASSAANTTTTTTTVRTMASIDPYSDYGKAVFTGRIADEYLKKHGSSGSILKDPSWTGSHADTVAKAVLDW